MSGKYEVQKIEELTRLTDEGGTERYYRARIKTVGGVPITVDINQADFTPEKSTPLLEAAAANADAILKSGK